MEPTSTYSDERLYEQLGCCEHGVVGGCDVDDGEFEEDPYELLDVVEAFERLQIEYSCDGVPWLRNGNLNREISDHDAED